MLPFSLTPNRIAIGIVILCRKHKRLSGYGRLRFVIAYHRHRTVQPKAVMFPTDAKLLNRARERLVRLAKSSA